MRVFYNKGVEKMEWYYYYYIIGVVITFFHLIKERDFGCFTFPSIFPTFIILPICFPVIVICYLKKARV